jgi:hypothetical protein
MNTDKLINAFIENVKEDVEKDYPNNATQVLEALEDRLHEIADDYMAECLLSSQRRRPSKEDLLDQFGDVYSEVISDYSEEQPV